MGVMLNMESDVEHHPHRCDYVRYAHQVSLPSPIEGEGEFVQERYHPPSVFPHMRRDGRIAPADALRRRQMNRLTRIAALAASASIALGSLTAPAVAQTRADDARFEAAQQRLDRELELFRAEFDRYEQARSLPRRGGGYNDPRGPRGGYNDDSRYDDRDEGDYDPARYYRAGPNYQERALAPEDRVYRGDDGKYYCKRSDGTTGLIIGAAGGGILGNVIDGGHSRTVGTLIGGALGALAGKSIDQNSSQVRCR